MSDTSSNPQIFAVGDALIRDIEKEVSNGGYDRFVFLTYGVKAEYLRYFSENQEIMFCGGDEIIDTVEQAQTGRNIRTRPIESHESHAKIYLMWNENEIKCWLGSFNFTRSGLRSNIEWVIEQTAPLKSAPTIEEVVNARLQPQTATHDKLLSQVIETIGAVMTHQEATWTDDLRRQHATPYAVLKNKPTNSLRRAVTECLDAAEGDVSITYFTPYVSRKGVLDFADAFPSDVTRRDVDLTVRTCRVEEMEAEDTTHLDQADIAYLEEQFNQFQLLARASGDSGSELADNRRLRSGFAHFKLFFISYTDQSGNQSHQTIFTTANLTHRAWQQNPESLEIGIWARGQTQNEQFAEFFLNQMQRCYVEPSDHELETVSSQTSDPTWFEQQWLSDHVQEQLELDGNELRLDWEDLCWPIGKLSGRLHFQDVLTGEPRSQPIELEHDPQADVFSTRVPTVSIGATEIIQLIELDVETRLRPHELRVTDALLTKIQSQHAKQSDQVDELLSTVEKQVPDWHQLVWNGSIVSNEETVRSDAPESIESVWIREQRPDGTTHPLPISFEPATQPHLGPEFVTKTTTSKVELGPLGTLYRINIRFDPAVEPRHDMIRFETGNGDLVPYYGVLPIENGFGYLINTQVADQELLIQTQPPYQQYYDEKTVSVSATSEASADGITHSLAEQLRTNAAYRFTHAPTDLPLDVDSETDAYEFITEGVPVGVKPPQQLLNYADGNKDQLGFQWRRLTTRYRGPQHAELSESIIPETPHATIEYQGTIHTDIGDETAILLTPANRFDVYEQVFVEELLPESKAISALDLSAIADDDLLMWLIFSTDHLFQDATVVGPQASIDFSARLDGETLTMTRPIPVLNQGEMFCIPIFANRIDTEFALQLQLLITGTTGNYAASAQEISISVAQQRAESELRVEWGDEHPRMIPIHNRSGQELPSLHRFADQIRTRRLKEYLSRHEALTVVEHGRAKLTLNAEGPIVLHLVSAND